jgi:hypothetical protein
MLLPVKLTAEEKEAKAQELASTVDRIKFLEADRREHTAEINSSIKERRHIVEKLVRQVKSGTEEREVDVEEVVDWSAAVVRTVRKDTAEVVSSRTLTPKERQQTMLSPISGGKKKRDGDAA